MIKIYIFADSYKHFEIPIKEYEKRLGKNLKLVKLKPSKNSNHNLVIKEETKNIIDKLKSENWYKIVLSPKWKNYSTEDFVKIINDKKMTFSDIIFVIGWAYGFDYDKLRDSVDLELNLWQMTMPHSLALLVLLEQVYRIWMIEKGTSYHK